MLDRALLGDLDLAVSEARFFGLRPSTTGDDVGALLWVRALPELGRIDPDGRRVVTFHGVTTVEVSRWASSRRVVPRRLAVRAAHEIEAVLDGARRVDPHGGFEHFDIAQPVPRLVAEPSLRVGRGPARGGHSWRWSADVEEADGRRTIVDVAIWFTGDVAVTRADGTGIPLALFAADGVRWWQALRAGDPRLTPEAQREAGLDGVIVPG